MDMQLFDESKLDEAYQDYVSRCNKSGIDPWDFDTWFDMFITDV